MKRFILNLVDITKISAGYPFRGKITEAANTGVLVVQLKNASIDTGIDWSSCVTAELPRMRESDWLQPGDILFNARGSHNFAVLVDDTVVDVMRAGHHAVAAPHFYVIQTTNQQTLPEYLVWLLNQQPCQRYFQRESEGSLTKSIRRGTLEQTPIVVPAVEKQTEIIQLARNLQQQRRLLKKLIANGETVMGNIASDLLKNA